MYSNQIVLDDRCPDTTEVQQLLAPSNLFACDIFLSHPLGNQDGLQLIQWSPPLPDPAKGVYGVCGEGCHTELPDHWKPHPSCELGKGQTSHPVWGKV